MAKDKQARQTATGAIVAWANLVGAIVSTMLDEDVGNAAIHKFLDHLERSNARSLNGDELAFSDELIGIFRSMVPGND